MWFSLIILIMIGTDNIPTTGIDILIGFFHLNLIVI